jgi:hypothetical protein
MFSSNFNLQDICSGDQYFFIFERIYFIKNSQLLSFLILCLFSLFTLLLFSFLCFIAISELYLPVILLLYLSISLLIVDGLLQSFLAI